MNRIVNTVRIPLRARAAFVTLQRGHLRANAHALILVRENEEVTIPVAMVCAVFIEPGVTVTHDAIRVAAEHDTLLVWTGEAGVRTYSTGHPGGRRAKRLIQQALVFHDSRSRLAAVKRLYGLMFGQAPAIETGSIDKLRGIEGAKVKRWYYDIANDFGVQWHGRQNAPPALQTAIGIATSCLYGLTEAAILVSGYSPAIGLVHTGDARSFVYDLADTVKFRTVIPAAFEVYAESRHDVINRVRRRCRDQFRESKTIETLFRNLFEILPDVDCASS